MLHLSIDTLHNRVTVDAPAEPARQEQFTRRWEAALLAALLEQGRHAGSLGSDALQARLSAMGQTKPMNRAQLQRLLDSLQAFLDTLQGLQAAVESPPRKRTVGPWSLVHQGGLTFDVDGQTSATEWLHVALTLGVAADPLLAVLSALLVADALASEGRYESAVQSVEALDLSMLSTEGQCLVSLRLCSWHRHLGHFKEARQSAEAVLAQSTPADPGLALHAQFFLNRITYDENPAQHWDALWQSTSKEPQLASASGSDWRSMCEWHNLRALLARRRMHQLDSVQEPAATPHGVASMHELALRHFQAALYMALWSRDWSTLQAYVANLAFHLQSCLRLKTAVNVTPTQVLEWHRLTMAYEDKLGAGRDSAWEYIFFAEFWLDHQAQLAAGTVPDPLAHHLGRSSPDQEAFYIRALERLNECGDDRQVAIGHSLYLRYAQAHLQGKPREEAVFAQVQALRLLLARQTTPKLLKALVAEGYANFWPAALLFNARTPRRGLSQ